MQGTTGNDTILGVYDGGATSNQNTLTAADGINGGDGKDSLYATLDVGSAGVLPGAQYSNVENFFIRNVSGVAAAPTFNFANVTGEEQVWNDRSTSTVTVTGLAAGTTVGVKGAGAVVAATNATYAAAASAANIALDGGIATGSGAVTVNAGSTALTSATLTSTNGANNIGGLNLANSISSLTVDAQSNVATGAIAAAGLTTITVKGAGAANLTTAALATLPGTVTTVDAAANTGGVSVSLNGVSNNVKFTGGSGNDTVATGGVLLATASVDAGAGSADRLIVTATNDIRVDGTSKALGDLYKGFEQVQVQGGVNVNLANLSTNNTIDTVVINDTTGATTATGLNATSAANLTLRGFGTGADNNSVDGVITVGLTGATTTGQIDTVKAKVDTTTAIAGVATATPVDLRGIVLNGVENLELTGSNGALSANVGRIQLDTTGAIDLASIKLNNANLVDLNGANDNVVNVAATNRAINLNIDATGSGDTQINAAAYNTITGATLTTGAGNDVITGSARADIISAGAGNDTLDGGDSATGGVVTAATPDTATYNLGALTVAIGDTAAVTVNGTLYTATATAATAANLATLLAAQVNADAGNAVSAAVNGNSVVISSDATGAAATLVSGNLTHTTDPAAGVALASTITTTIPAANATAANSTLTFSTTAGVYGIGDVVAYNFTDADGTAGVVSYTVIAADIVADAAVTAANIANKFIAEIGVDQAALAAQLTATRAGNVVTITSATAGATVSNSSVTLTADATNTAAATLVEVSNGTDATAQTVDVNFNGLTFANGDVVTLNWNDGAARTVSYTVLAGDGATQVANGLDAAWGAGTTANVNNVGGVLTIQDASAAGAGATITAVSTTINRAPIATSVVATPTQGVDAINGTTYVGAADRLTGGDGQDVFTINYSNVDTALTDNTNQVTFTAMDTITDLNLGGNVAGTNVDTVNLPFNITTLVNAGTPVAMASTAADLYDAVQALYNTGGTMDTAAAQTAGLFTFNGDTYLIAEALGNSVFGQDDVIIKVTGVTGTLSLTDLV